MRGEPINCTPEDAYRCFMRSEIDYLSVGNFVLERTAQPRWQDLADCREEFQLD